jgi:hypothetical protein
MYGTLEKQIRVNNQAPYTDFDSVIESLFNDIVELETNAGNTLFGTPSKKAVVDSDHSYANLGQIQAAAGANVLITYSQDQTFFNDESNDTTNTVPQWIVPTDVYLRYFNLDNPGSSTKQLSLIAETVRDYCNQNEGNDSKYVKTIGSGQNTRTYTIDLQQTLMTSYTGVRKVEVNTITYLTAILTFNFLIYRL